MGLLALTVGMALVSASVQLGLDAPAIAKRAIPAVVFVKGTTGSAEISGSGFIISTDGKIVTSFHIIQDLESATVRLPNSPCLNRPFGRPLFQAAQVESKP